MSDKLKNLKTLSLADNDIGKTGILGLVGKICPASQLAVLNLKSQRQPVGEEDMDEIMEQLARTLGRVVQFLNIYKVIVIRCI